jgi:ERF superfamily
MEAYQEFLQTKRKITMEFRSENINELAESLAKAQGEFPNLQKRSKAYNYMYADMAEIMECIREALAKNGLSISNHIQWNDYPRLVTTLLHGSGQWMSIEIRLAFKADGKVNEMQAMGSALTYARRYAISCLLNLAADKESDDDGEKSSPKNHMTETQKTKVIDPKQLIEIESLLKGHEDIKQEVLQIKGINMLSFLALESFEPAKKWIEEQIEKKVKNGN